MSIRQQRRARQGQGQGNQGRNAGPPGGRNRRAQTNPSQRSFQGWVLMNQRLDVAANQTTRVINQQINATNCPELAPMMTQFQRVTVNSLGCRVVPSGQNVAGNHATMVLTRQQQTLTTIPTTPNLRWMRANNCKQTVFRNQSNAPPASDGQRKQPQQANATSVLGNVIWTFEGPSDAAARDHLGTIEVYVDALFEGLKA